MRHIAESANERNGEFIMLNRNEWRKVVLIATLICGIVGTPACAQDLIVTHRISAALANEAVEAAVSFCAPQGYKESAAVVDIDGVAQATLRGDGAGVHTRQRNRQCLYQRQLEERYTGSCIYRAGPTHARWTIFQIAAPTAFRRWSYD
jgi:hypothetical protein